ncbi:MAG: hypothetical protein JWS12_224 [Candidatus Saccharibacteria bacterium]|nr:hypothetical protein [Candidatus Saccharibacteria bacterium]
MENSDKNQPIADKTEVHVHEHQAPKQFWRKRNLIIGAGCLVVIVLGLAFVLTNKSSKPTNQQSYNQNTQQSTQPPPQVNSVTDWASPDVYTQLPECNGQQLLSAMPLDDGTNYDFIPLGLINATGGHAQPSDHPYFDFVGVDKVMNVRAPGNVTITKIRRISRVVKGVSSEDTSIYFMPCKQVGFYFNHVHLGDVLNKAFPASTTSDQLHNCQTSTPPGETVTDCYELAGSTVKVKTGDILATVHISAQQRGWDFGGLDARAKPLAFANPKRYSGDNFHGLTPLQAICPIDYFPSAIKEQAFSKPGFSKRPSSSRCGEINQDKAGSIQGNWYADSSGGYVGDWAKLLSIVHYNLDPSVALLSAGGGLGQGGILAWGPTSSTIDPEPSQTTVGTLYCVMTNAGDGRRSDHNYATNHHILLQLTDATTMKAEYKTGSCTSSEQFVSPILYYR